MNQNIDDNQELDLSLRQILSQNIRKFRKDLHLTQERLAENADISLPYLSDIEHCKTWVSDKTLIKLARRLAYKCAKTKESIKLEPMTAYERKIVHKALQNDAYVTTHSEGEEPRRCLVIELKPKDK